MNNYDDVYRMHVHHRLPVGLRPNFLDEADQHLRESFLREEMLEFFGACVKKDLPEAADALIDIVFIVMGTAVQMGLPWQALWQDVLRANMTKVSEGRGKLNKPKDWRAPRSAQIVDRFRRGVPAPAYSTRPHVVCLCGSTKFRSQYEYWNRHFTLKGWIVLSVGMFMHAENEELTATSKAKLDQLHLHKIDMSDSIFVINAHGYIGESTTDEIEYAASRGKDIHYLDTPEVAV